MTGATTSVNVRQEQLKALDDAALQLFGTKTVPKHVVIDRLLRDHSTVEYDPTE